MTDRLPGMSTLAVHAGAQPDPPRRVGDAGITIDQVFRVHDAITQRRCRAAAFGKHHTAHQPDHGGDGRARRRG